MGNERISVAFSTDRRAVYGVSSAQPARATAVGWSSPYRREHPWRPQLARSLCDMPADSAYTRLYARSRPGFRWHVREEDDACRARFDQAVTTLRADLLRYMRRRLRDPDTAADLTQETLLRMLRYRDVSYIQDYALLMYRIAHNLVLEHGRRRRHAHAAAHVSLDLIEPLAAGNPSVDRIIDAQRTLEHLLTHTLATLPPRCREAFVLHRLDGLSYPEVAAAMGISIKMVEKHVSRGLAACRAAGGERPGTRR